MLLAAGGGTILLLPAIMRPVIAIAVVALAVGIWLATKSVAYPLAVAFAPTLVEAIYGSNPLPAGGTTFLFFGWIGLAVAIAMIHGQRPNTLFSAPIVLSLALFALMVARLGGSLDPSYGSRKLQLFVANNLVFMIAGVLVGARRRETKLFLALMLAISAAGAVLLMGQLAAGTASNIVADRFSISAQEYPITLGRSSSDGLLLATYAMIAWRSLPARLAATAVFPALAVTLIAAGSRGPVLAFAVGLIVLLTLSAASGRARAQLGRVAVVALGAAILVPLVVPGSAVGRALSAIFGGASGLSTNGRAGLWAQSISAFGQHPLLGIGTGGFAGLQTGELYPHNVLLECAVELGVLGGVTVAWIIVASLRRMLQLWKNSSGEPRIEVAVVVALFVTALVNGLFSGAIQDNREMWLWAGIGLGMACRVEFGSLRTRVVRPAFDYVPINE